MRSHSCARDSVVMVGFGKYLLNQLSRTLPDNSVVVVEDPDIVVKRRVEEEIAALSIVRELVVAPYFHPDDDLAAMLEGLDMGRVSTVVPGLEYGVRAAAELAARHGLPGAGVIAGRALTDKLELRRLTRDLPMSRLGWREVHGVEDVAAAVAQAGAGRVVLKPANRHASLGVQILDESANSAEAWAVTSAATDSLMLPDRDLPWRYVIEDFVEGEEFSTEALVADGKVVFVNVTRKQKASGPYPVELGHTVPAAMADELTAEFATAVEDLVTAISMGDGILHAEWLVADTGLVLIECAGRVPGDAIVTLIDVAYDIDLTAAMIGVLSGDSPRLPRTAMGGAAIRFVTSDPGTVITVSGVDAARDVAGVIDASVSVAAGDEVRELRSSWDRVGQVLAMGESAQVAGERADRAHGLIVVEAGRA